MIPPFHFSGSPKNLGKTSGFSLQPFRNGVYNRSRKCLSMFFPEAERPQNLLPYQGFCVSYPSVRGDQVHPQGEVADVKEDGGC
jgi:hypothetical protein